MKQNLYLTVKDLKLPVLVLMSKFLGITNSHSLNITLLCINLQCYKRLLSKIARKTYLNLL